MFSKTIQIQLYQLKSEENEETRHTYGISPSHIAIILEGL